MADERKRIMITSLLDAGLHFADVIKASRTYKDTVFRVQKRLHDGHVRQQAKECFEPSDAVKTPFQVFKTLFKDNILLTIPICTLPEIVVCDNYFISFNLVKKRHRHCWIKRHRWSFLMADKEKINSFRLRASERIIAVNCRNNKYVLLLNNGCRIEYLFQPSKGGAKMHMQKIKVPCTSLMTAYNEHVRYLSDMRVHIYQTRFSSLYTSLTFEFQLPDWSTRGTAAYWTRN
ncbi:unnamed protein product [Lepeophtheirus salmonis]|uniref:(salmon louse) hypothetical protein n=1 Tax=Lepeophtheirus salmonis TaxID=72036 RepID=A0A7R8CJ84_LEPSM|nr:unnamed protein product [Lepeophtheirus salmonis]CAF2833235.1 unnamed protein product [Lepeophtheirus salmonis]